MKNIKVGDIVYENFMDYCNIAHVDENTAVYTLLIMGNAVLNDGLAFYRVKKFLLKKYGVTLDKLHKSNTGTQHKEPKRFLKKKCNIPDVF